MIQKNLKNMFKFVSLTALASLVLVASGCASMSSMFTKTETVKSDPNEQIVKLNEAANQVSNQLNRLMRVEQKQPENGVESAKGSALKTVLTVQWDGSAELLVSGLADQIGFRYIKSGVAPFTPIIVPLDAKDRSAETILRIVGDRLIGVAELRVSEKNKTIEIAYKKQ